MLVDYCSPLPAGSPQNNKPHLLSYSFFSGSPKIKRKSLKSLLHMQLYSSGFLRKHGGLNLCFSLFGR